MTQPYIIYAPDYHHRFAGGRVMHWLCQLLNEAGQTAYIYESKTNPRWNTPVISRAEGDNLIKAGAIAVYPEITRGNPLKAKTVVRYILNNPGLLGGDKKYHPAEILFCFSNHLLQPGMTKDRILVIPIIDTSIFYLGHEPRQLDYLVYFGKHKKVKGYPEEKTIYRDRPARQEELGQLLRNCQKLISYDTLTALNFEATLCGCPVVIIPDGKRSKEQIAATEFGFNGTAWGESQEEWAMALKTLPQAQLVLKKLEEQLKPSLANFITITQASAV